MSLVLLFVNPLEENEAAAAVLFETYDQGASRWVHRSYFMK